MGSLIHSQIQSVSPSVSGAMAGAAGTTIELDSKQRTMLRNRFFPPLLLLKSLNEVGRRDANKKEADAPLNRNQTPEEKFRIFVNKLAQICEYRPKGHTITACTVLVQTDGRILYLFASNGRSSKEKIRKTLEDVKCVLNMLRSSILSEKRESDDVLHDRLLRQVLSVNHVRITSYLVELTAQLQKCIEACGKGGGSDENMETEKVLRLLLPMVPNCQVRGQGQTSPEYITSLMTFIEVLQKFQQLPAKKMVEKRAAEEQALNHDAGCWSSFQHATGRVVSYQYAVESIINASHIWDKTNLFLEFDVEFLPSSSPHQWPLQYDPKSEHKPKTAHDILGRVTSPDQVELYRGLAKELQMFGLDDTIGQEWQSKKFTPIVHAEMLLHDYLESTPEAGGTLPHRFFNNWRYIGSSKPICRLCRYYFDAIATPVGFRPTHGNIYYNWRLPDMYRSEQEDPIQKYENEERQRKKWRDVMNKVKFRVCADVMLVLKDKGYKKKHDTNTTTDRIIAAFAGLHVSAQYASA
ncbi:hypothetical protein QBC46DRAFT_388932 [Diplogelasinospora grovesii]|uniref:Uncharacterized protein n=1 Tax=Diplogelasinospora grovesii TaxID=303347 RepID=A0AAN6S404_9PEZI|nr:hypothetical protein QBC46DRAFT_388932 [Diplogelasinospora grovesii]